MKRLLWDVSHSEFSITDHYYFSKLENYLKQWGVELEEREEPLTLKRLSKYDILVLCYPEKPFNLRERRAIRRFLERGGKVIIASYYRCSDRVATICNSLTAELGIKFHEDEVLDPVNCLDNDPLLLLTSRISPKLKGISRVFFPCSASLEIEEGIEPLILGEETARSAVRGGEVILSARVRVGKGELVALGTCVFWDNFAIEKFDNLKLCEILLST
ncbi:hypothetical protein H5T88_07270 [bacterium]|nr:hypothetical protein [bacterium]